MSAKPDRKIAEKVVITGGLGFIGSHVAKQIKNPVILDLGTKDPTDLASYVQTKCFFEEVTSHLYKPVDVVFDLATMPLPLSIKEPYKVAYKIYCMGTVLCELLREGYFKTLVHVSSSEVFDVNTPYAAAKDAQDKLIRSYVKCFGLDARIVRPFNTYGEGQDLGAVIPNTIKRILRKEPPIISGDGRQARDFVYVRDTVRGILDVYKNGKPGDEINISSGDLYTMNEIVKIICELMNYSGPIMRVKERTGDTRIIHTNNTIDNPTPMDIGLTRTINWWKKNYR